MSSHYGGRRSAARKLLVAPILVTAMAVAMPAVSVAKSSSAPGQVKKTSTDSSGTGRKIR